MSTFKYINKLKGQRILIFGATQGMGYAVAEASIEHEANIIISSSNPDKLSKAVERLRKSYPQASKEQISTITCDLSQIDGMEERLREVLKTVSEDGAKPIDHIVSTAGNQFDLADGIKSVTMDIMHKTMSVRLLAPVFLGKIIATSSYFNKSYNSSMTFTGGSAHIRPPPGWSVVALISGGIEGLIKGLAVDLAPVRVNVVQPGAIDTESFTGLPEQIKDNVLHHSVDHTAVWISYAKRTPTFIRAHNASTPPPKTRF
ncbi:NAD(P)-binding protein [Polyplosphaeria fusca]|uniref:NAD(P)-binding protein n=1 Tax=Polyplosphaeria fusca TaxID=682080 RepID=A0A9P4UX11_9PLEO|nr:NAD(P)-binding protein [Polyplosphaeria fusca]